MGYKFDSGNLSSPEARGVDTIYKVSKVIKQTNLRPPSKQNSPKPNRDWFYFYKALQIVLSFWIVTILTIVTYPWLDYWVKSGLKKTPPSQILSQSISDEESASNQETSFFSLKNSQVDIKAPIVEGIDERALKNGIGHHPDSVWPNQKGNVVLAGHNFDLDIDNPYGRVFISLRLIEINDDVTIVYQNKKYIYQIFKKETTSTKDNSLIAPVDDWILTFYTCDPPYTDWKRLIFQARLIKIE